MSDIKISLKAVRANAGKTQDEWAEMLGVTRVTVKNWESGITKPDIDKVRMMSEVSKIPMDCIFLPSNPNISN